MFGGTFSVNESGDTLFSDGKPEGFTHFIEWQTAAPVTLRSFRLFAVGDGPFYNNQREFAQFTLKTKPVGSSEYTVLYSFTPTHSYTFVDQSNSELIEADVPAVTAQLFRAEFVQYNGDRGFDGPRVLELDGFETSIGSVPACFPAPGSLAAWWPGDGDATEIVNGNAGSLRGGTTFTGGEVGQSFSLNGIDGRVEIKASPTLNVGVGAGLTVEGWIRPSDVRRQSPILEWNSGRAYGTHFYLSVIPPFGGGPGCLYANLIDTNGLNHIITSAGGRIRSNEFQHVALTYDKATS
jgi:hypothetical protein